MWMEDSIERRGQAASAERENTNKHPSRFLTLTMRCFHCAQENTEREGRSRKQGRRHLPQVGPIPSSGEHCVSMPSRKRAQGQTRKAKASAVSGGERAEICRHGFPILNSRQQQVIDTFSEELKKCWPEIGANLFEMQDIMIKILETHPNLFRVDENRKLISNDLVFNVANNLLEKYNENDSELEFAQMNTYILLYVEGHDFTKDNPFSCVDPHFIVKHRNLMLGCKRSLVKFYRKRTTCSCLDKMYTKLKPQSKTGMCRYCAQRVEHRALIECSICKLALF